MSSIDKLVGNNVASTYQTQNTSSAAASATTPATGNVHHGGRHHHHAATTDSVQLSDSARALASARDAVQAVPDVRQDKVSAIKQSLTDGTYQVNSSVLARNLLNRTQAEPTQQ